ncbi:MAG: IS1634 family transposase, partial [Candidatus Aureabacteria bacterium]|nr:IS1634 family transposase [Candidatus Auribacterota bacterium]
MFVRSKKNKEGRIYLQLVENYRDKGKNRQRVLFTLGRLDTLQKSGKLDSLIRSTLRFSEKLTIIDACKSKGKATAHTIKIGPVLVFERLWKETGIGEVLQALLETRRYRFSVERAVFLTVLHRLCCSGSDRAAEKWKERYAIPGAEGLELHHLYRAMAWLGKPLKNQKDRTFFAPRCIKDDIEERLFEERRDLFTGMDLVFFDTTSIYFEGNGGQTMGRHGHSKDHRPDCKQIVVGVVLDNQGSPVCCEMWPGNTSDVKTLLEVVKRLKKRFGITQVCVVSDRGMISKETIKMLESREYRLQYILGSRMRKDKEVKENVLRRRGHFQEVTGRRQKAKDPSPLKVKEVKVDTRRYIVCLNEEEARKDKADRETILASLRLKLKQGDKVLVGNKGYRRFLKVTGKHFAIDKKRIKEEELYDGKWVIRTNTDLSAEDVALKYKQLWMVEDIFRTMKSILETRPIYHKCDETIRGHVFCSFLGLVLRKALKDRLDAKGLKDMEWKDIVRDLDNLHEIEESFSGKK